MDPEVAELSLVLRPGMVFRSQSTELGHDEELFDEREMCGKMFLCIANLDWAVLAWPLELDNDDNMMKLDIHGELCWHIVWGLDQFEAAVAEPVLHMDHVALKPVCVWRPAATCMLNAYSADLVFRELATLSRHFGIEKPNSFKRCDLLFEIAMRASGGDSDFAEAVVNNDGSKKKQDNSDFNDINDDHHDEFVELLLENMDMEDAADFIADMKLGRKAKDAKKKQWQQWRKEALDVPWLYF